MMGRESGLGIKLAEYRFPERLQSDFERAIYQIIVGVEQRHSQESLDCYAKRLRELADYGFQVVGKVDG